MPITPTTAVFDAMRSRSTARCSDKAGGSGGSIIPRLSSRQKEKSGRRGPIATRGRDLAFCLGLPFRVACAAFAFAGACSVCEKRRNQLLMQPPDNTSTTHASPARSLSQKKLKSASFRDKGGEAELSRYQR